MNKLIIVTNELLVNELKDVTNVSFLYPLKDYSVGYELTFSIDEIDDYCLINRSLNDFELDNLKEILNNNKLKGIVFDDLGVLDIVKEYSITKILLLDHLATNVESINYYLGYVDSVVVSNDLTKEEIEYIVKGANKKLVVNVFGLKTLMYSRRNLLSNYQIYHKLDKNSIIDANIDDKSFKIVENKYGTVFYAFPYYNALELLYLDNVLFFLYNPLFLDNNTIKKIVTDNDLSNLLNDSIFLHQKTFYKLD